MSRARQQSIQQMPVRINISHRDNCDHTSLLTKNHAQTAYMYYYNNTYCLMIPNEIEIIQGKNRNNISPHISKDYLNYKHSR